jgi:anthranilate synthase component 1
MNITQKEFEKKYSTGTNFFLYETIPSDIYTPVSILLKISKLGHYHCLLESVTGGEKKGRYSIIALDPDLLWVTEKNIAKLSRDLDHFEQVGEGETIFKSLRDIHNQSRIEKTGELPSMAGGLFGFMGYDMVCHMENLPEKSKTSLNIPDSLFFRPRIVIVFDNIADKVFIVSPIYIEKNSHSRPDAVYKETTTRMNRVINLKKVMILMIANLLDQDQR